MASRSGVDVAAGQSLFGQHWRMGALISRPDPGRYEGSQSTVAVSLGLWRVEILRPETFGPSLAGNEIDRCRMKGLFRVIVARTKRNPGFKTENEGMNFNENGSKTQCLGSDGGGGY